MSRLRLPLIAITALAALIALPGCVAYPVHGYGEGPRAQVYVPAPSVYVGTGWGYRGGGGHGGWGGHRSWGHGGGRHWR